MGNLMGKEYRGVLLVMLVLIHSVEGRSILKRSRSRKFKTDAQISEWSLLLEILLEWDAYLNSEEMSVRDLKKMGEKNRYVMHLIRKVAQRKEKTQKWKLMKFHAIFFFAPHGGYTFVWCASGI